MERLLHTQVRPAQAADAHALAQLHTDRWRTADRGQLSDTYLDGPIFEDRLILWTRRLKHPAPHQHIWVLTQAEEVRALWGALLESLAAQRFYLAQGAQQVEAGVVQLRLAWGHSGIMCAEESPMPTTSATFTTTRQFPVPPAAVFKAIQDPACLATWWGPDGFTNRFEVFEFEPQGRWVFTMVGPDGTAYPNESVFAHIEADRQVVIRHVCPPLFQLTFTLEPSAGGTLLHWEQAFDDPAVAQAVRHMVEPANEQNLNRLGLALG
jgi:uncharacterized protein YndB with AHSA1/START domain